jgi:hypothetical protein
MTVKMWHFRNSESDMPLSCVVSGETFSGARCHGLLVAIKGKCGGEYLKLIRKLLRSLARSYHDNCWCLN